MDAQHIYNIRNHKETDTHLVAHFLHHGLEALNLFGLQTNTWTPEERHRKVRESLDPNSTH